MAVARANSTTHSRNISMLRDRLTVFPSCHRLLQNGSTAGCAKTWKRQLVTLDHEATFVETWHAPFQTTRQNRCLYGFRKCRGALVPHLVVIENEELQSGVGLAMLHSSDHTTQQTPARMLSHNAAPAWPNLYPQKTPREDAHNLSATTRPVCCTSTCHLNLRPTMPF